MAKPVKHTSATGDICNTVALLGFTRKHVPQVHKKFERGKGKSLMVKGITYRDSRHKFIEAPKTLTFDTATGTWRK